MAGSRISAELEGVIARFIHSVEEMEILCLLAESPDRPWRGEEVFRSIQSSPESVARNLNYLADNSFLAHDPATGFRFSPKTPELRRQALELVKAYREKRVTVIETIYKRPLDPIRDFADAFKIRKDKP